VKNCTLLIGTITLQYYAILWQFLAYRGTQEYPSTDCLIFIVKLKHENHLIRFVAASDWNVVRHPGKCHWAGDWPMV